MLQVTPGLSEEHLSAIYSNDKISIRAVILRAYGAGNVPSETVSSLIKFVKKGRENKILTFFVTQCTSGNVKDFYESSAASIGAIGCEDMTLPAAFAKIAHLLGNVKKRIN